MSHRHSTPCAWCRIAEWLIDLVVGFVIACCILLVLAYIVGVTSS